MTKNLKGIIKRPIKFHMIPYHLQYETRDCFLNVKVKHPSLKIRLNREQYIRDFNPYLKTNVSYNLDQTLVDFYQLRYRFR